MTVSKASSHAFVRHLFSGIVAFLGWFPFFFFFLCPIYFLEILGQSMVHIRKKWLEQLLSSAHFVQSICGQLIWYMVCLLTKGLGWPVGFGSRYIPV
jgi:hypothetical protein